MMTRSALVCATVTLVLGAHLLKCDAFAGAGPPPPRVRRTKAPTTYVATGGKLSCSAPKASACEAAGEAPLPDLGFQGTFAKGACKCTAHNLNMGDLFGYGTLTSGPGNCCPKFGETSLPQIYAISIKICKERCDCAGIVKTVDGLGNTAICFKPNCSPSPCGPGGCPPGVCRILPTRSPTKAPTTKMPTKAPTKVPTKTPTTKAPTTKAPTTSYPTSSPTKTPTKAPTPCFCCAERLANVEYTSPYCQCSKKCENPFGTIKTAKNVFVVDVSGSMSATFCPGCVPGSPSCHTCAPETKTNRLRNLKKDLVSQLNSLKPSQSFQLIAFNSTVMTYPMYQATPGNLLRATAIVDGWVAGGNTATKKALVAAQQITKAGAADYGLYFLSDGQPDPTGSLDDEEIQDAATSIIHLVKSWVHSKTIPPINTDGWYQGGSYLIQPQAARTAATVFMKKMASMSGGRARIYTDGLAPDAAARQAQLLEQQKITWQIDRCKAACGNPFIGSANSTVFVVDTSGSMNQEYPAHEGQVGANTRLQQVLYNLGVGYPTGRLLPYSDNNPVGMVLSNYFAVISYSAIINSQYPSPNGIKDPNMRLVQATVQNLAIARDQVAGWVAAGTTSTGAAMTAALEIGADAVFLLSDGIPTDANGAPNMVLNQNVINSIRDTSTNPRYGTEATITAITFTGGGKETKADKQTALSFMSNVELAEGGKSECLDCTCQTFYPVFSPCQSCGQCRSANGALSNPLPAPSAN